MATSIDNSDVPQWKKDLIARLRNQNKCSSTIAATACKQQQLSAAGPPQSTSASVGRTGQQPSQTWNFCRSVSAVDSVGAVNGKCNTKCKTCSTSSIMVQERMWLDSRQDELKMVSESYECGDYNKSSDSDSSEDLHYGPGIVNKLKNKYLSLALRENSVRSRPTILHLRKAASLENILDDNDEGENVNAVSAITSGRSRLYQSRLNGNDTGKNVPNRYRNASRTSEMKRARSVETISRRDTNSLSETKPSRESMHEDMLICNEEGNDRPQSPDKIIETTIENKACNKKVPVPPRINRPKRITPMMNDREKPPVDVVKQAKMIFEKRAEQRTRPPQVTGEVAAKVATYRDIIVKAKAANNSANKPPVKVKPIGLTTEKPKIVPRTKPVISTTEKKPSQADIGNGKQPTSNVTTKVNDGSMLPSPIPDVSRVEFPGHGENEAGGKNGSNLCETPDLIMTSSPYNNESYNKTITEKFLKEEISHSAVTRAPDLDVHDSVAMSAPKPNLIETVEYNGHLDHQKANGVTTKKASPLEPLTLELNGFDNFEPRRPSPLIIQVENKDIGSPSVLSPVLTSSKLSSPVVLSPRITSPTLMQPNASPKSNSPEVLSPVPQTSEKEIVTTVRRLISPIPHLTNTEIEKNLRNKFISLEQSTLSASDTSAEEVKKIVVPKPRRTHSAANESNCMEYNFTNRKGTPSYIRNDKSRTAVAIVDIPKAGEGGVILLPGASLGESFTDEDEEIMRSLEAPPSPCDVTFVNDNILIDGKSSLNQKTKKVRMKISFVEAGPEIYEYPSENSLLIDEGPPSPTSVGHTVPILSGSTLANYIPKGSEDFQPGITRSIIITPKQDNLSSNPSAQLNLEETEKPILFSAGTNSDILF